MERENSLLLLVNVLHLVLDNRLQDHHFSVKLLQLFLLCLEHLHKLLLGHISNRSLISYWRSKDDVRLQPISVPGHVFSGFGESDVVLIVQLGNRGSWGHLGDGHIVLFNSHCRMIANVDLVSAEIFPSWKRNVLVSIAIIQGLAKMDAYRGKS